MTGEQQHQKLLAFVAACAQRLRWPELSSPITGGCMKGEAQWREVLRELRQQRNMSAVAALDRLADELHDLEKGASQPQAGLATRAADEADDDPAESTDISLQPSPRELAVFFNAARAALAHVLQLPADACRFLWFDKDEPGNIGGYVDPNSDPPEVWLARGLPDGELFATVVHELAHVQDIATLGREPYLALSYDERERRAWAFEARVTLAEGLQGVL